MQIGKKRLCKKIARDRTKKVVRKTYEFSFVQTKHTGVSNWNYDVDPPNYCVRPSAPPKE